MSEAPGVPESAPLEAPLEAPAWVPPPERLAIRESSYRWTARLFSVLERVLKVNLKLHGAARIHEGQIFVFNHFARFETFIPQYFVYRECGAYSRSIASSEFFAPDDPFSDYLLGVGAVPNRLPDLLPFLAGEALRGRKIIVFPEGGMVKDCRVVDERGGYSVFSRTANVRRKHHSGAAVLALGLDAFKHAVVSAHRRGDGARVHALADSVSMAPRELIEACDNSHRIVPANITFYPIRVGENLLSKGAELINRGLSRRLSEELMIEGNILLEHTDMDIRLAPAVDVDEYWRWWERPMLERGVRRIATMADAFTVRPDRGPLAMRLLARCLRAEVGRVRDQYMHRMYTSVSVNLSHLTSSLVLALLDAGRSRIEGAAFRRLLYLAVKRVQRQPHAHLHRSLRNPQAYAELLDGRCEGLDLFLATTTRMGLIAARDDDLEFLPKLAEEHHFDAIRLENLVEVYANELMPLTGVVDVVESVAAGREADDARTLALHRVDDERLAFRFDREAFRRERHEAINSLETATESAEPWLLEPDDPRALGVVLVHGFLASPAELRGLGEKLRTRGHRVYGVRLKGHGTSPWDLRERSYEDWLESLRRGIAIVSGLSERVAVVGFSTGGSLALHEAATAGCGLAGVCAIAVPVRFRNPHMRFVPLVHGANRLVRTLSRLDGVMPFTMNESENPHINYRHMPMRGLYELRRLVDAMLARLAGIRCPVRLLQGTHDPVVVPESAERVSAAITGAAVDVCWIESERHGIVHGDVGDTHERIIDFVASLE